MTNGHGDAGNTMDASGTYQSLLRAIGASIDRAAASGVTIMEATDGFLVRSERIRHTHVDLSVSFLTRDALQDRDAQAAHHVTGRVARRTSLWTEFPHTYEDFFRALGFELDDVGARYILLDELEGGLLLSYNRAMEVRQLLLRKADIEAILNEAVQRRRQQPESPLSTRLGVGSTPRTTHHASQPGSTWKEVRTDLHYQPLLRAVGAVLDEQDATRVCVMEALDAFAVRFASSGSEPRTRYWMTFTELEAIDWRERAQDQVEGAVRPDSSGGYQDVFRALGYELEGERASGILIDFQTDALTVTYSALDPAMSFRRMKRHLILSRAEQDELLVRARSRRQIKADFLSRLRNQRDR